MEKKPEESRQLKDGHRRKKARVKCLAIISWMN